MTEVDQLAELPIFASVPREALEHFCQLAPVLHVPAGMTIMRQGSVADLALLVVDGRLKAEIDLGNFQFPVGAFGPGEIIGERALFSQGGTRSATVTAVFASTCRMLTWGMLGPTAENAAVLAMEQYLVDVLTQRLRRTQKVIRALWRSAPGDFDDLDELLGER